MVPGCSQEISQPGTSRTPSSVARAAAADTDAFYAARPRQPCPERVLGLQADGKGIVMLPGSLRPGTAAQAAKTSPRLATRLSPGEKHGRKRICATRRSVISPVQPGGIRREVPGSDG